MTAGRDKIKNNMERETFDKASSLTESLNACEITDYILDKGGLRESVDRFVSIIAKNDKVFKDKLRGLIKETQKRLQKEFDEL